MLLMLPFGGAVLEKIGVASPEVEAILDDARKTYEKDDGISDRGKEMFGFFRRKQSSLPAGNDDVVDEEKEVAVKNRVASLTPSEDALGAESAETNLEMTKQIEKVLASVQSKSPERVNVMEVDNTDNRVVTSKPESVQIEIDILPMQAPEVRETDAA